MRPAIDAVFCACGITCTVGSVNFLFDPAQQPHLSGADLCAFFGVS